MTIRRYSPCFPLVAFAACLSVSLPAMATTVATTFVVNSTADTIGGSCAAGSATCTLRAAVQAANAALPPGVSTTITVPAGTYLLSQSSPCAIRTNGDTQTRTVSFIALCVTGQTTINGAGAGLTIIDAQQLDRVLSVGADAVATLNGVTLQNGLMNANSYPDGGNGGGGGTNQQPGDIRASACAPYRTTWPTPPAAESGAIT